MKESTQKKPRHQKKRVQITHGKESSSFLKIVDRWVLQNIDKVTSYPDLVNLLPSVCPIEVAASLNRLGVKLPMREPEPLLDLPGPLPHPIDFDWRFHPCCYSIFLSILHEKPGRDVGLLGCPSIAIPLSRFYKISLAEKNKDWVSLISGTEIEAQWGEISLVAKPWKGRFDFVIMDPPWYPVAFRRFIGTAAAITRRGGFVFVAWPPEGVRPGLHLEWLKFSTIATAFGLEFVSRTPLLLRYATPFFEAQAFKSSGLPTLASWRRADLLVFSRNGVFKEKKIISSIENYWGRVQFGELSLRVRMKPAPLQTTTDFRLRALVPGEVFPTVSRRDKRRKRGIVWTTGNRAFECLRPDLFFELLNGLNDGKSASKSLQTALGREINHLEKCWLQETLLLLKHLEVLEKEEYATFLKE